MPEIPEIETVRCHLEHHVLNKGIVQVIVNRAKALNVPAEEFTRMLTGQRVIMVKRRAKQIIMGLSNNHSIVIHFMLEGYVRLFYPGEKMPAHPSVAIRFETGEELGLFKINLGYVHLAPTTDLNAIPELNELGPEPLDRDFTLAKFLILLGERKGMIKPLLMEQQFIAGIGNVYSNEILFCAGIMPTRKVADISVEERKKLYGCIRDILRRAVARGGVYEEKFASDDSLTGGYEPQLQVAYRTGQPCFVCGHAIETKRIGGRNAFYCPICQK